MNLTLWHQRAKYQLFQTLQWKKLVHFHDFKNI